MKIWDMQQEYGIIKQFLILLKSIKSQLENIRKPESYIFNKSKCTCMYVCMHVYAYTHIHSKVYRKACKIPDTSAKIRNRKYREESERDLVNP